MHAAFRHSVCCSSASKAAAVARKYPGVRGTTSLHEVLDDKEIDGVFVAATPSAHFAIARAVLESGKALFVEKPPCTSLEELDCLIETAKCAGNRSVTVGFQRRFSPVTDRLRQELRGAAVHSYHYRFLTGGYPEGDVLTDLFIHPLDWVCFLFGVRSRCCWFWNTERRWVAWNCRRPTRGNHRWNRWKSTREREFTERTARIFWTARRKAPPSSASPRKRCFDAPRAPAI